MWNAGENRNLVAVPVNPNSRTNPVSAKLPAALDALFRAKCAEEGIAVQEALNRLVAAWVGWKVEPDEPRE